jgi:dynein heavy chain 1
MTLVAMCIFQYIAPENYPIAYPSLPQPPGHRDAVINAFVFVHLSLHQANTHVQKRGGRTMAITPRHYLDFINHFVRVVSLISLII